MVKIVNFSKKLPKSKQPKCDSYDIVKDAADDPLTVAKLEFFCLCCWFVRIITLIVINQTNQWFPLCTSI